MVFENIFYGICWNSLILIIWFKTDWIYHYCKLLGIFKNFQTRYSEHIITNPESYFPDYINGIDPETNRALSFLLGLVSCPFCVGFWLSVASMYPFCLNLIDIAPVYVFSLLTFVGIKKLS